MAKQAGASGLTAVLIVAALVGGVAWSSRLGGYVSVIVVLLGVVWLWRTTEVGERPSLGTWVVSIGIILSSATCGLYLNNVGAELEAQNTARQGERQRETHDKKTKERERELEREKLLQEELSRPLAERAVEAENRILEAPDILAKAHAICYADHLLATGDSPTLDALRDTRNKVTAKIKVEYRKELNSRRVLICRDGVESGCQCSGSRQGCCSGHGGVSRCEPKVRSLKLVCDPREPQDLIDFHLTAIGRPLPKHLGKRPKWEQGLDPMRWYVMPLRVDEDA